MENIDVTSAPDLRAFRYHLISKGSQRFLVKEIDRRPDFDLIVALKLIGTSVLGSPRTITIPSDKLEAPFVKQLIFKRKLTISTLLLEKPLPRPYN
jgi:hypothetical protein